MKAYKGFNKDMTCRGFQFEEGETYELPEGEEAKLCVNGFHACENPLDCFGYYSPAESVFHEVELDATDEKSNDSKRVGRRIKIGAALDVAGIVKAHFEYVNEHCNPIGGRVGGENEAVSVGEKEAASAGDSGSASAGDSGSASAGNYGSASAGKYGSASAGERGSASAGDYGSASAGNYGSASAGNYGSASAGVRGSASAGDYGSASAGNYGSASAGLRGSASAGDYGSAVSRGYSSVGANGVACARGNGCIVCGGIGAVLVLCEEKSDSCELNAWKAAVVDGKTIKPDTWYTLKDGEFVEAE